MAVGELESLDLAHHTHETIIHALATLALVGGNAEKAAAQLKEHGVDIPGRTIRHWRERYPERYRLACEEHAPKIEQAVLHRHREIAHQAADAILKALELETARIDKGEVKDAASSAKNLSMVGGIAIDKALTLQGRPTNITEHRTAEVAIDRLERLGLVVDSSAEELSEAPEGAANAALPRVTENKRA